MKKPDVIVITGPTATGKTALGASVAVLLNGEVISADSMQVYRHMDIGTAKPSSGEMLGVPHHMLDVASPLEDYSVSRYIDEAALCIDGVLNRGKLPVLVGGTGLYIDSLLSGRGFSPRGNEGFRRELEERYEKEGGEPMLEELRGFDPESAARLHANDRKRIVRAFEIHGLTGKTITQHDKETQTIPERYNALKFALTFSERSTLYARIEKRVDDMLEAGFYGEVENLLKMGVAPGSTAMQAIGYREIAAALLGESTPDEAAAMIKQRSRNYAKRQLTWLRRDEHINWIAWEKEPDIDSAIVIIKNTCHRSTDP